MDFSSLPSYPGQPPRPDPMPEPPKKPQRGTVGFRVARRAFVGVFILFVLLRSFSLW